MSRVLVDTSEKKKKGGIKGSRKSTSKINIGSGGGSTNGGTDQESDFTEKDKGIGQLSNDEFSFDCSSQDSNSDIVG